MGRESVLQRFAEAVAGRLSGSRVGAIDWSTIIAIVIPMVLECFKSGDELRECCANPTPMQRIGLNLRLRKALRGQFRPFQLKAAVDSIGDAMIAEARIQATSQLAGGGVDDPFADAFAEAQMLAGG